MSGELKWSDDDTVGRTEPEPVDVWADQGEVLDWVGEPCSDELLSIDVRVELHRRGRL